MIEPMLKHTLIIFLIFLHKKVSILLAPIKYPRILRTVSKIDLDSVAMLGSIHKFAIIYLVIEIVQDALILPVLGGVLSEVDTVLVLFYDGMLDSDGEVLYHFLEEGVILVVGHRFG